MSAKDPSLDREIEAALEGVNLQDVAGTEAEAVEADSRGKGGDRLYEGLIVGVHDDDVIVELGPRMQGVASLREFEEPPAVGSKAKFTLRGREDGLWLLSRRDAVELATWEELQEGSHVKARVSGQNQGGLELKIGKHDAFMPASQVAVGHVEDLSRFLGQTLTCEVLEIDRKRKRVVLSARRVLERELEDARRESAGRISPGQVLTGKVTRVEGFGAFVEIGAGLEGLVHVSNISRKRVEDVSSVLEPGQEVQVMVLDIKEGGKRIGLGMKQLEPDPWDEVPHLLSEGSVVTGKVTRLMEFGAFVELLPGIEGLLHVSQLGPERVRKVSEVVKPGDEVSVRVQSVDRASERISLSRLDQRGAVIGSEDSVEAGVIEEVLQQNKDRQLGTNLGALFKKALEGKQ